MERREASAGGLTSKVFVIADGILLGRRAQLVQTIVGDLEHPTRGDDTVGRLEIAVTV